MIQKCILVMLDPFILPRLDGISAYARSHNWILIPEDRVNSRSDFSRFDGALTSLRGKKRQITKVRKLLQCGKPVVDLTVACNSISLPRVVSDHEACGRLAAKHLTTRGFEHFAWYSSAWSRVHALRYRGFARALPHRPERLTASALSKDLVSAPKPLAIVTYDEPDAAQIIDGCQRLGISIPDSVSVISIGNDPFLCENRDITISSVDTNLVRGGYEAAAFLDSLMSSKGKRREKARNLVRLIPPLAIVSRKSTDTLSHQDSRIRSILIYIHRNLERSFGAAEIAKALGIPRTTLDRIFQSAMSHSIGAEIMKQRLARAKRLMLDPRIPLKSIAAKCGFCNCGFLSSSFRKAFGTTPSSWRQTHRQKTLTT